MDHCPDCGRSDCPDCGRHYCCVPCECERGHQCPCECDSYDKRPVTASPAATLRAAADRLDQLAAAAADEMASNPYWDSAIVPASQPDALYGHGIRNALGGASGELAAAMHSGVGGALAEWLRDAADDAEQIGANWHALAVARAILYTPGATDA